MINNKESPFLLFFVFVLGGKEKSKKCDICRNNREILLEKYLVIPKNHSPSVFIFIFTITIVFSMCIVYLLLLLSVFIIIGSRLQSRLLPY